MTVMRKAAFEKDGGVEEVITRSLSGIFTSQCEASSLTRENMTFTGSCFSELETSKEDYNFSPRPCILSFQGWDYEEVRKTGLD